MATKKSGGTKEPKPVEKGGEATFRAQPEEPEVISLCLTCLYVYPRCGGDGAPGFKTENGVIVGCSMYQIKPEAQPEPEPAPIMESSPEPKPKQVPERLRQKREIQAKNLAASSK